MSKEYLIFRVRKTDDLIWKDPNLNNELQSNNIYQKVIRHCTDSINKKLQKIDDSDIGLILITEYGKQKIKLHHCVNSDFIDFEFNNEELVFEIITDPAEGYEDEDFVNFSDLCRSFLKEFSYSTDQFISWYMLYI